jgi:gluconolactonase
MFGAPPSIEAEVFAVIPERYRRGDAKSDWADVQVQGSPTPTFLEGPVFDAAGNLWVTDIPWGRLFKIAPDGEVSVGCEYGGQPNGMKFLRDGTALIADHALGMMRFDPASGAVTPWVTRDHLEPFKGCNDLTIADNGDVWFTDQGQSSLRDPSGRLYRVRAADGRLDLMLAGIPGPNGLVLNKAETALLLAVTRANAVWKLMIHADGTIGKVGTWLQLSGGTGPDGLAIDEDDNLVVCHVGLGAVWLFSRLGEPVLRINAPEGLHTTNCAFGGEDNRTLYITESATGTILRAVLPMAGRRLWSRIG